MGLLAFFTACMIHVGSYKAIGYVESIRWYWVSELILTVIMGALVVEGIYNLIRRIPGGTWVNWGITAVLGVMLVSANWNMLKSMAPWVVWDENKEAYLGGAQALEAITQPGDLIGSTGGGTIAYFIKDRTVVNLDGLINSYEYFQHLQAGNARDYLDRIGLDYVYGNEYMLSEADPYWAVLKNRLDKIGMVAGSTLFHYKIQPDQ
ncbi:MAG: hypothetical protein GYA17_18115 [Chloroflexi bacterium]|nr:hypothetical protein [Chloroflexota bacterium]